MPTVDSLAAVLTANGAVDRNSEAWPRWGQYVWPNDYIADDFADEVGHLKDWLVERIAWMDEKLDFDPNAFLRGDVNSDGQVNVSDATALINYLLTEDATGIDLAAADLDENGLVNISDATTLIGDLLNGM